MTLCSLLSLPSCCCNIPFIVKTQVDGTKLGPACAASLLTATDGGMCGLAKRVMPGLSCPVGILSTPATSALVHPEDAGLASYNINLCGSDKVGLGGLPRLEQHETEKALVGWWFA